MPLSYKQLLSILSEHGFSLDRQKGSHQQRVKEGKTATIPYTKEYPPKTAKSILQQLAHALGCEYKDLLITYKIKL